MTSSTFDPATDVSDGRLVQWLTDISKGDEKALSHLYHDVSARLYGLQLRILKDHALAEEALQETFIRVWNNAGKYSVAKGRPLTWLSSMARYQAIDVRRRELVRHGGDWSNRSTVELDTLESAVASMHTRFADSELLSLCMGRLPVATQQCLLGVYFDGYTHDEICAATEQPLGTVKSWIRRGLKKLRDCFDEHG